MKENNECVVQLVSDNFSEEIRIAKTVPKESVYYRFLMQEIKILQTVKSAYIPGICDVFDSEDSLCMVEEYIDGENLYEYVKKNGLMSREQAINMAIELAKVLDYLHSKNSQKVCHLDIQPKNIIIKKDNVYLIDFENGRCEKDFDILPAVMATKGFASPKQFEKKQMSMEECFASDIYGLGMVIYYMLTGSTEKRYVKKDDRLMELIWAMTDIENGHGRLSAKEVISRLEALINGREHEKRSDELFVVSVAGIKSGVGATYVSFMITDELIGKKKSVAYEEANDSNLIRKMAKKYDNIIFDKGYFIYGRRKMRPLYPENIRIRGDEKIVVRDEGVYDCRKNYGDILVLVAESDEIGWIYTNEFLDGLSYGNDIYILFNRCSKDSYINRKKSLPIPGIYLDCQGAGNMQTTLIEYICRESDYSVKGKKRTEESDGKLKNYRDFFGKKR